MVGCRLRRELLSLLGSLTLSASSSASPHRSIVFFAQLRSQLHVLVAIDFFILCHCFLFSSFNHRASTFDSSTKIWLVVCSMSLRLFFFFIFFHFGLVDRTLSSHFIQLCLRCELCNVTTLPSLFFVGHDVTHRSPSGYDS